MQKFEKYLKKENTPMPQEHLNILEKGAEISSELMLPINEINKLLDAGYLGGENGFRRNS